MYPFNISINQVQCMDHGAWKLEYNIFKVRIYVCVCVWERERERVVLNNLHFLTLFNDINICFH